MASESLNRSLPNKPDVLSAVVSNLAVIIQIIAVGAIGLADVLRIGSFFQYPDLITLANFVILLLSFSFIGIYNFHRANREYKPIAVESTGIISRVWQLFFGKNIDNPLYNSTEKKLLRLLFFLLVISVIIFFYLTYKTSQKDTDLNFLEGVSQLLAYITTLVASSILIYIWIKDSFDKSNLFTENNFIPNLRGTLIEYGHVKSPTIIVHQNIQLDNGNRLLEVTTDTSKKYFVASFDGNKLHAEITREQYTNILNPQPAG